MRRRTLLVLVTILVGACGRSEPPSVTQPIVAVPCASTIPAGQPALGGCPAGAGFPKGSGLSGGCGGTVGEAVPACSQLPAAPSSGSWKVLATADTAGAGWSPDGHFLLVWNSVTNGSDAQQQVSLDDAHGSVVRTFQGELPVELEPVWLDARSFVVARNRSNLLGTVDSTALTPITPRFPAGVVSSGHGALAYETSGNLDASARFAVWTPAGTTPVQSGIPVAWSNDGTKLAVWHWASGASGPGVTGWIEVLSWPGLRSLGAIHQPLGWTAATFDASGRYVLANGSVLDLETGRTSLMPLPGSSVSPAPGPANAARFPAAAAALGEDQRAVVSADGSTVVIWTYPDAAPIVLIRDGLSRSIEVPGRVQPPSPELSPDGASLVVTCLAPDGSSEALLMTP
jgi:hypothetical protein